MGFSTACCGLHPSSLFQIMLYLSSGDTAHTDNAVQQQSGPETISAQTLPNNKIPLSPFSGDASQGEALTALHCHCCTHKNTHTRSHTLSTRLHMWPHCLCVNRPIHRRALPLLPKRAPSGLLGAWWCHVGAHPDPDTTKRLLVTPSQTAKALALQRASVLGKSVTVQGCNL